jgi:hypothetical protein
MFSLGTTTSVLLHEKELRNSMEKVFLIFKTHKGNNARIYYAQREDGWSL